MFRNLLSRLFTDCPQPASLTAQDAEVAVAALLVRLARADDHYGEAERQRIDQILMRRRGLDAVQAAERRAAAEMIEAEAPDTVRFTRSIKDRIDLTDRNDILMALWQVAYADGRRDQDEESFVRLVAGLLGIADRDSALARQRALEQLGLPPA
ncbi:MULTISPECIES: tellurite resistance TerB family protein [unclassified Paracoccus (in: a-proteobacteria)]|uniref:tellurite resistance TerB family protein n=1 Tax=unclassified Paracoccus (in: a-proteobacteria) TaxID=2688777 RepID=UPI0012B1AED2|nr:MULTISPECIES: TerB family tellurite resistance protein [unclassified Paracoccus (in: a-proteobacteria)]UXU74582.1 TerB family tellurite resistance protein [Paracoccus sp. SMMA_5]UXU80476.1 TerB family tellurite resistance protein [Paracoccus sp. SMMA_5_TC]